MLSNLKLAILSFLVHVQFP